MPAPAAEVLRWLPWIRGRAHAWWRAYGRAAPSLERCDFEQEAVEAFLRGLRSWEPGRAGVLTHCRWHVLTALAALVRGALPVRVGRNGRTPRLMAASLALSQRVAPVTDRTAEPDAESAADAHGMLRRLPARDARMLARHAAGETFVEIAEDYGVSRPRVHEIVTRARDRLRAIVAA